MGSFCCVHLLLSVLATAVGDKFVREELGVSGRLRFTSGQYSYYNCSIVDKRLVSNMKIGIYIHDHTTYIHYEINDTESFSLTVNKIENFYFANIYIRSDISNINPYVELSARNKNNGAFLGTTLLRLTSSYNSALPAYLNATADTVINILDDVFVGSVVGKLSHRAPHKEIIFYLEKSELESMHAFSVSPDGRLIVTKRLNAKKRNRYKFKVNVGYLHSSFHSSINVHINILQGIRHLIDGSLKKSRLHVSLRSSDTMPEFVNNVYNFSISELAVPNTIIGRLTEGSENVTFTISNGNVNSVFAIDKDNSVLYVNKQGKLDYEEKQVYKLHVKVKHNNLLSLATKLLVYVYIIDENDNPPVFAKTRYYFSIMEDSPKLSTLLQVHANDKDSGNNAEVSYLLANENKVPFDILSDGTIILASEINLRTMPSKYYLYVRAVDGGKPLRQETEVLVEIEIIGANLHPPIMEYIDCDVMLSRTALKSPLITINAIDEDINSNIRYYLLKPVIGLSLNATSGAVTLDRSVNYTMLRAHVFASDGLHNTSTLPIDFKFKYPRKITNCRDNIRYFKLMSIIESRKGIEKSPERPISLLQRLNRLYFFTSPGNVLHIDEDSQLDTPLGVFKVGASKIQCHSYILYSIASGNVGYKFQIDLFNGTLYLYDKLEGHKMSAYKLEIKAYDIFGNSISKFVNIKVDNINDTIPVFTKNGLYECNKTELRLGLCKVSATVNGNQSSTRKMTYTILNGVHMFRIDLKTGVLSMRKSLHAFTENFIRIEASYGTKDVAHAVVHIVETGSNNNPPLCLSHQQRIKIATNTPAGAIVGRIFGYDIDDGKAGKITYTVLNKTTKFDAYFSLHPRTGLFRLKKGLTVKDKGYRFSVVVKLEDGGRPMLTTTCKVFKIIVDALGIYQPVFDHKEMPLVIHISSNIANKAVVAQLNAAVSSQNKINYQIVDGCGIGLFFIDRDVGKIRVSNTNFKKSFYWLTVQAYVKKNPLEYTNAHVLIRIRHVTLKEPYFNPSIYHVSLVQDEQAGKNVVQLFASDGYQGFSTDNIIFSIHSGDNGNIFGIKQDGWLFTKHSPPVGNYALNMSVANRMNTSLVSHGQVIVSVTDQGDKPIIFVGSKREFIELYETRGSLHPPYLFQCLAADLNINYGMQITYEINSESPFQIDSKTAVVSSKKELRAGENEFVLIKAITAKKKSAARLYYIKIIRRPFHKTRLSFKKKEYSITLKENSAKIFDFRREVVTDSNKPVLFYVITGNDDLMFTFPPGSSLLVPVKELDFERQSVYSVGILAFDGRSLAETKLFINLINIDDNPLSASQPCFEAKVLENRKGVAPLITVQVTDLDHRGGGYFYELMGSVQNKDFNVLNNGAINMKPEVIFDREVQSEHVVSVLAGITRKALTTFCVIVVVEDVNDNKPNFTKPWYEMKVLDSTTVGSRVMAVYASDDDSGANALLKYSFPIESSYFGIESRTGVIYVKKDLAPLSTKDIILDVHVRDGGTPSFYANAKVKITVLPDWNSFSFEKKLYTSSIKENVKSGSLVAINIKVNNTLVNYEIAKQEDDCYNLFWMDPFTGIILTTAVIDAEEHRNCSFVVNGIMHGKIMTSANVFVKIEDENDNKPIFGKSKYEGSVLESQKSFTSLLDANGHSLIINTDDFDDGINGKVKYSFIENSATMYFMINENTGEILTSRVLDYEKHPKRFEFHVKATDQGFLALSNVVPVSITLINVNDKKPEFLKSYLATLFLPVYNGTFVEKVVAIDDMPDSSQITYHLDDPYGVFEINKLTGEIVVWNPSLLTNSSVLTIYVTASDGLYDAKTVVRIKLSSYKANKKFKFIHPIYHASVEENDRSVGIVKVINPVGYLIGERLFFTILNPTRFFEIGNISGAVKVKEGAIFDRELVSHYLAHVEVHKICDTNVIARTTINVSVVDLNDNPPLFSVRKYFRAFDFDTKVGTSLLKVSATDADEGENAKIIYSIKSQSSEDYFRCDKFSGEIILKKRFIKRHTRLRQILIIQAADNGRPVLTSETKVEIVVLSKDQPMFTKTYEEFVSEDSRIGHNIIRIDAKGRHNRQVYYEIKSGDDYGMFSIGFTSGELSVNGRLNYSHTNSYKLVLKAIDSLTGSWSEGECAIEVLDINDNFPIFEKPFYDILVPENTEIGTQILNVRAHDMDDGSNAYLTYSLSPQSDDTITIFNINSLNGEIVLLGQLDSEMKSTYILHITASDHGNPRKSSFTTARVRVGDLNDNPPYFIANKYDFFADSNQLNNQFIGKVHAFDPDVSDQLTYSLERNSSYIRIDLSTGAMYLLSSPKDVVFIKCTVIASDKKHEARVPIEVRIHTRNEERPLLKEKLRGFVPEGSSKKNDFILNVQSEQLKKEHSKILYQIDSELAKKYFSITSSGDLLSNGETFDRESISKFIIPVRATNRHGMFSLTDIVIKVLDENDHPPLFEFPTYESYVVNSQMSAKSLIEVKAFDMDEGRNAELAYTTQGLSDSSTPIHMNKTSGLISLAGHPKGLMYQFSARVSDNGFPIWQSLADVQIAVKRWTDELIVFSNASYHVRIDEDHPINSLLVTIKASLKGYNGDLHYSLIHGNLIHTKATHFQIDDQNGNLYLSKPLDYEKVKQHKLMVRVVSTISGDSGTCFVCIDVNNVNDNTPIFDSSFYNVNIAEDVDIGESIIRVCAADADDVSGKVLRYKMIGESAELFSVDRNSGWVKVVKSLDRELQPSHRVKIRAIDHDGRYATTTLFVNLIDVNDCSPLFYTTNLTFFAKEDELVKQTVARVEASDDDSTSVIQYFIKTAYPDKIFAIDIDSGEISLLRKLTKQSYEIIVIAYDGVHTSQAIVSIQVIDVNNHTPLCLNSYYVVAIDENTAQSRFLVQIKAEDDDPTDRLKFIIQGDGIGKFHVNSENGDLTVNSMLDHEDSAQYHFKVVVADLADHMCTSDVFIKVTDVNDNRPRFEQDMFFATVRENVSQSVVVTQVKAIDQDRLENRKLHYRLEHKHDADLFAISPRGVITINKLLPRGRERIPSFSIIVTATDNGNPKMSSSVNMQILVLAVSDTPPKFNMLGYVFEVFENEPYGKMIGSIKVSTSPNLKDEEVVMELVNSAPGVFALDSKSGNLSINALMDYEMKHRYIFNVKAYFKLIPSLSSMVNVEVLVLDINDHKPQFLQQSYYKQIDENVRSGTFVLQSYASDADGTPENSQFSYSLISDKVVPFMIDGQTGVISVSQSIDYEVQNSYSFHVIAEDNGSPKLSSLVKVTVNITDLNDNPPIISRNHSNVIVVEGTAVGSDLLKLFISDRDSDMNGAPFYCSLFSGDSERFSIITGKDNSCIVRSETNLHVEENQEKSAYDLTLRVTDSGSPKQFSMSAVEVVIVKESHYPPVIQDPKLFFVIVSKPYVVTNIGAVKVFDNDESDIHQFKITAGNDKGIFSIQEMRGIIEGKPSRGVYSLSVEVTDGKFSDSGVFKIVVNELGDEIKIKSVVVTFSNIDANIFIHSKMMKFIKMLANICGSSFENVFIWSIQNMETKSGKGKGLSRHRRDLPGVMIALAVLNSDSKTYLGRDELKEYLINSKLDFEDIGLYLNVLNTHCSQEICPNAQKCLVTLIPTEVISYSIPNGYLGFKTEEKCYCDDGSEGPVCYPSNSCLRNPCKFGEKCIQTEFSYRCECIDGAKCNMVEEVQTFNGNSFVRYMLKKRFDDLFSSLSIDFRTESQSNEILFYAYGKDYFTLEIEAGILQARFDFGSGVGLLSINTPINDDNWHHIQIDRYSNYMKLSLDYGKFKVDGKAPGNSARININGYGIIFGAGVSEEGSIFKGFQGCLKQPKLGRMTLPFGGSNDIVESVESHNMQAGCKDSGMCTPDICPHFSDCKNTITSYVCKCLPGHYGPTCKSDLTCADRPCKNEGTCTYTQVRGVISYQCSCKSGFTGPQCHISLGACSISPCENDATCIPIGDSSYDCRCLPGYTGSRCEINENPCASKKCYFGGRCVNLKDGYKCECPAGRTGRECASGNYCQLISCQNGGVCNEQHDGAYCSCKEGFTGSRCNLDINECLLQPCPNDRTCVNTFGSYYCNCSNGIKSKDCKMVDTSPPEEEFSMVIVVAGALVVLIMIIIIIIIIICVKKRRHQYAHAQTDDQADIPKYPLDRYGDYDNIEMRSLYPPNPPPRGVAAPPDYFDDQMSAAMYDPSAVTFSHPSLTDDIDKVPPVKFSSRTSVECNSDEEEYKSQPGYHWDYSEVPEDVINMKMSREGSRIGAHDQYYSDDQLQYVDMPHIPQLPQRPASRRSSMHGYSDCDMLIPELPELPVQVRASRQSLKVGQSPSAEQVANGIDTADYDHRYSLYDANEDSAYIQDILGNETGSDITTVTRPSRPYSNMFLGEQFNIGEGSEISEQDGYTETSLGSDDDDDAHGTDPLDPENTRKLERDIKRLIKDLQKRTEED